MRQRLYRPVLALGAFLWLVSGARAGLEVPVSDSLQQDGAVAQERRLPILLAFSALECPYCRQLEEDFLEPMLLSGEYTDKVIIRRLLLDNGSHVTDFDGQRLPANQLASRYQAWLTPTIVFLDATGREVTGRMVGINTPELFGGYLDTCIEMALLRVRDPGNTRVFAGCEPPEKRRKLNPDS